MGPEDLPYRAPFSTQNPVPDEKYSRDDADYSTLRAVHADLLAAVEALSKDFNLFDIDQSKLPAERAKILLHQVEVKQSVYAILAPLLAKIESTTNITDTKFKQR